MVVRSGMSRPSPLGNAIPTESRQLLVRVGVTSRSKPDSSYHRPAVPRRARKERGAADGEGLALGAGLRARAGPSLALQACNRKKPLSQAWSESEGGAGLGLPQCSVSNAMQ